MTTNLRAVRTAVLLLAVLAATTRPAAAALDAATRARVFDTVWRRVAERHYDPKLGGVDWKAVRAKYAPLARKARGDAAFYTVLNRMLGELKQSHFGVIPPDDTDESADTAAPDGTGETGMTLRLVENRALVAQVEPDGPAARAGVRPGFVVTHIDGKPVDDALRPRRGVAPGRELPPAEARLQARIALLQRLSGPPDQPARVRFLDAADRPRDIEITRRAPQGEPARFGNFPPVPVTFESRRLAPGGIGYVRFSLFMMPVLDKVEAAVREMRDAPGIIIDLRGNFGGIGALAPAISRQFVAKQASLGTMTMRRGRMNFVVFPEPTPYAGPLVILIDEASLSTSEILALGLQELGRATVIGQPSAGMALPSVIEKLPGGARFQYAFADFKTPKGTLVEGRGVRPDVAVPLTRRAFLASDDPALAAAVAFINQRNTPPGRRDDAPAATKGTP